MIAESSVSQFLEDLSSRTPTPGGGATAAVAGALGGAQLLMVAEFADWSDRGAEDPRQLLRRLIGDLLRLADEDAEAYAAFRAAPKDDAATRERIRAVPREVTSAAEQALEAGESVREVAPEWFRVDLDIAHSCLRACRDGAHALEEVNS